MSRILSTNGGQFAAQFFPRSEDRTVQDFGGCSEVLSDAWARYGVDALWDRSGILTAGAGASNWGTNLSSWGESWDVIPYMGPSNVGYGQRRHGVSGVTRDSTGAVLTSCSVKLFDLLTDTKVDQVTSDASTGSFTATTPYDSSTVYAVTYHAAEPSFGSTPQVTAS